MSKVLGVNGIRTHGKTTTDKLLDKMLVLGYKSFDVQQVIRNTLGLRWHKERDARAIIDVAEDGDAIICHSYGAIKTAIAMRGITFSAVFFFRPAMGRGHRFHTHGKTHIYCIHSVGDMALWSGSVLLFHPFGLAGVYGFKDPYVENIKTTGGHNSDFEDANLSRWVNYVQFKLAEIGFEKD